jgi:hypothetical protein
MIWGDALAAEAVVQDGGDDHVRIRGTRLDLAELVDRRLFDPAYAASLRAPLLGAQPFPHLVLDGWFNPRLLDLVHEEFDLFPSAELEANHTKRENTFRSRSTAFGPATSLYFSIVNAGWFVDLLSDATGVANLVPDAKLHGGGLHESRRGGSFHIHRDFDHHPRTGLYNEMVLLTYLNHDWDPQWNGALELWDATASRCVKRIQPEFGRSVLMRHGLGSFHGHVDPLAPPPGRTRRSLGAYYYSNRLRRVDLEERHSTYLVNDRADRAKLLLKGLTPPLLWRALQNLSSR